MKTTLSLSALLLFLLTACSTAPRPHHHADAAKGDSKPETVLVNYYPKSGQDMELQDVLARAWKLYRSEGMVLASPHVIVKEWDPNTGAHITEIFTWVNHSVAENAPDSVKKIWSQEQSLCEPRNGHPGLGGGEVQLVAPAAH